MAEMGRPPVFTPELVDTFIDGISKGIPLRQLCRDHDVGKSAWYELMQRDATLSGRFAQARVEGFDEIAEECLEIADAVDDDYIPTENGLAVDHEHIQRSKLRIETRLKLLAKWDPRRYGDKIHQEVTGKDGAPLLEQLPTEKLVDQMAEILKKYPNLLKMEKKDG